MSEAGEIIKEISALSYLGMWLVSVLANVVIPVPEEIILLAFGYLAGTPAINGFILVPLVISGLLTSDTLMYLFSRRGNKILSTFYDKMFARQLGKGKRQEWVDRNLNKAVFFSRFMLQLRFLGPFLAGQKKMSFKMFFSLDLLALVVYVPIYMALGWYFHSRIDDIVEKINAVKNAVIIILSILALFWLMRFLRNLFLKIDIKAMEQENEKKD
jgi:membrane-associated protein